MKLLNPLAVHHIAFLSFDVFGAIEIDSCSILFYLKL